MLKRVIVCLFVGFYSLNKVCSLQGKDYKGTKFLFSFLDNFDSSLEVFITTDSPGIIDVNVSTPLYNTNTFHTVSLTKGQVKKVTLPKDIRGIGTELGNRGVQILSNAEVAVFAVNKDKATTDAYVVLPTDTLGKKYYIISWPGRSVFMIIATKDNTTVNINLVGAAIEFNGRNFTSGMILSIHLSKWQTFHAYNETADFTGTFITSNNEIAVLSGNKCVKIGEGACDHTVSQMTPVETFGPDFVAISMPNCNRPVSYRILSSEDNTNVNISGMPAIQLSTAGDFYTFEIQAKLSKVVAADKPIAMAFFAHGSCDGSNLGDPAMVLMPPLQQFAADYTFATIDVPTNPFRNSLTIVIRDIYITGLVLDGQNISSLNWRDVDGSAYFKVNDFSVNDGSHTVYHVDPTVTFLAVSTGLSEYNSYGFSAGQRLAPINSNCTESVTIPGDIIDNDCDGFIDEEIRDGKDNDGDGRVDEDLAVLFGDVPTTSTSTVVTSTEDALEATSTIQTTLWIYGMFGLAAAVFCCIPCLLLVFILKKKRPQTRVHNRPKPPLKTRVRREPKPPLKTRVHSQHKHPHVGHMRKPDMSWNRF